MQRVTTNPAVLDLIGRRATGPTTDGIAQLKAVMQCLDDVELSVEEIGLRRPTLDEAFLALTGGHGDAPTAVATAEARDS